MSKVVLAEGIVLGGIAFASIMEGMYLITHKDPNTVDEIIGPGSYILILAVPLMIVGLSHIIAGYRTKSSKIERTVRKQIDPKLAGIFLVTAAYIYLIGVIGYLLSTLIFFVFAFKLSGVTNWRVNFIVTFAISFCYYIVFVKCCDLIFPKAMFF